MTIRDFFKSLTGRLRKSTGGVDGVHSPEGDYSDDAWIAGDSIPQLEELRAALWKYGSEARASAPLPIDPEQWSEGRIRFDHEFSLAENTQGLRHRLTVQVSNRVQQHGQKLAGLSQEIASSLHDLKDADHDVATTVRQWQRVYDDVQRDEGEFNKYSRTRRFLSSAWKYALIGVFVFAETAMTLVVFQGIMGGDRTTTFDVLKALTISIGIVVGMVAVPHYSAIALKEGLTRRHKWEVDAYKQAGKTVPEDVERKNHMEQVEDKGSKLIAAVVIVLLAVFTYPLATLRAHEFNSDLLKSSLEREVGADFELKAAQANEARAQQALDLARTTPDTVDDGNADAAMSQALDDEATAQRKLKTAQLEVDSIKDAAKGGTWLIFFFLFQVVISAFFFLLEWVNHGESAVHLKELDKVKKKQLKQRRKKQRALADLLAKFDKEAQAQVHVIRSAPHYDQQLVSDYYKVVRELRELIRREHPDLSEFLHFAPFPQLPVSEDPHPEAKSLGYLAVPITVENNSLDGENDFNARHPINRAINSIIDRRPSEVEDNDDDHKLSDEWLNVGNPYAQLYQTLARWGFQEPFYARPSELDDLVDITEIDIEEIIEVQQMQAEKELRTEPTPLKPLPSVLETQSDDGAKEPVDSLR